MRTTLAPLACASVAVALIAPGTTAARSEFDVRDESTISRTLHFEGSGERTLDVRTISGAIRVIGSDRDDVQLDVLRTVRAESDEDLDAADRDVMLDVTENRSRIEAIVRENEGNVCGEQSRDWRGAWRGPRYVVTYDFAIQVPRETRVRLCTINGREVVVDGTSGGFDIENVNGRILLPNLRGSGRARTVNGAIVARFLEQPREASEFKTLNGDVIVGFPADLAADLKMRSAHGRLFTDFDVEPLPQPVPVAERRNGQFVYRSNWFTLSRVGRGGPELTFETFNGSVRVIRAAR